MNLQKTCTKCGTIKALEDFPQNKALKSGYVSMCKECVRIRTQKYEKRPYVIKRRREKSRGYKKAKRDRERIENPKPPKPKLYKLRLDYFSITCEICGHTAKTLTPHLRAVHRMTAWEYKEMYGLNKNQPLECLELTEKKREAAKKNKTHLRNFRGNEQYRYKKGDIRSKVQEPRSEQKKYEGIQNIRDNITPVSEEKRKRKLMKRAKEEKWHLRFEKGSKID